MQNRRAIRQRQLQTKGMQKMKIAFLGMSDRWSSPPCTEGRMRQRGWCWELNREVDRQTGAGNTGRNGPVHVITPDLYPQRASRTNPARSRSVGERPLCRY